MQRNKFISQRPILATKHRSLKRTTFAPQTKLYFKWRKCISNEVCFEGPVVDNERCISWIWVHRNDEKDNENNAWVVAKGVHHYRYRHRCETWETVKGETIIWMVLQEFSTFNVLTWNLAALAASHPRQYLWCNNDYWVGLKWYHRINNALWRHVRRLPLRSESAE